MGFDMKSGMSSGHFGLVGMRERAELAGGKLKIESEKGKGTKVVLTI
jgi:two-component system sensor histidine kinase DegS